MRREVQVFLIDRLRNISRLEIPPKKGRGATIGWQVRFLDDISKFFSDKKQGGKEKALEEAKLFRDAYERELKYHPESAILHNIHYAQLYLCLFRRAHPEIYVPLACL